MTDANKQRIADQLSKRGEAAVASKNFDYAIDCFLKCTRLLPTHVPYRKSLRDAEKLKYNNNGKGGMMAGLKIKPAQVKSRTARARQRWENVIEAAEEGLQFNPWDFTLQADLAHAAKELGDLATALWTADDALAADPKRAEACRLLADMCEAADQLDRAVTLLERARKLDPDDTVSGTRARELAARSTLRKSEAREQANAAAVAAGATPISGDTPADEPTPAKDPAEVLAELQLRVDQNPKDLQAWEQLGDLYRERRDFKAALSSFKQAYELGGQTNADLKLKFLETHCQPYRREIKRQEKARERLRADADEFLLDEVNKRLRKLQGDLLKREAEYFHFRGQLNPDDASAHYELGFRLLQLQQFEESIKALQRARADHAHGCESRLWLGYAFWKLGNSVLADRNFGEALEVCHDDDEDMRKRILYFRGCAAQEAGDEGLATDCFNEIAAIDFAYRDVAQRLRELNS